MILYRFVDIFRDFIMLIVKEKICPHAHTKNPQDVDNPVDNLGTYTNQLSICLPILDKWM